VRGLGIVVVAAVVGIQREELAVLGYMTRAGIQLEAAPVVVVALVWQSERCRRE
jgi:hypothetical protein